MHCGLGCYSIRRSNLNGLLTYTSRLSVHNAVFVTDIFLHSYQDILVIRWHITWKHNGHYDVLGKLYVRSNLTKLNGCVSVILQYTPVLNGRHFKDGSSDLLDKHLQWYDILWLCVCAHTYPNYTTVYMYTSQSVW